MRGETNSLSPFVLRASGVSVRYGTVTALTDVELALRTGSVHALVGENGAGKSTLMRVLSGALVPGRGTLVLDGVPVAFASPREAQRAGIRMIHQELSLVPALTVAENIFLGSEPTTRGVLDRLLMRQRAQAVLQELGEEIDPDAIVGRLSLARREMVEIAKALVAHGQVLAASRVAVAATDRGVASGGADSPGVEGATARLRVLILDEPTAILSARETEALFARIATLAASGTSVVYCSHRLDEIAVVADQVTVLRDGRGVAHGRVSDFPRDALIRHMVGRPIDHLHRRRSMGSDRSTEILRVERLRTSVVHDVSFGVGAGEIVGLVGLVGAGRTELARAMIGADHRISGDIILDGVRVNPLTPRDAVRAGMGFVPEDRGSSALIAHGSVRANMTLARLRSLTHGRLIPVIDRGRERSVSATWATSLRIRADSLDGPVNRLSGGNQQKVVLARWLIDGARPLRVLIVDEPTRGVDVGARADIYAVLRDLASRGTAILVITSDLEEALVLSDRLLVMREGRIVGSFAGGACTAPEVAALMVPA